MLRRLHPDQPDSFAFAPANMAWARAQMTKYPEGRRASAVIPLLWRAQEQEGWLSRAAIEEVARMLDMATIRVLEVATFYFMFQLQPVGSVAHVQVCGTTSCMICGAEDLVALCRERIAARPHLLSADGRFSWEEVECLGACANAPMAQIGKDYYEDLTAETLGGLLDGFAAGEVPVPGPQAGRFAAEPAGGETTLKAETRQDHNASVALAVALGDTTRRIDGTEVALVTPWREPGVAGPQPAPERDDLLQPSGMPDGAQTPGPRPTEGEAVDAQGATVQESHAEDKGRPERGDVAPSGPSGDAASAEAGHAAAGEADGSAPVPGHGREGADGGPSPLAGMDDAEGGNEDGAEDGGTKDGGRDPAK